MSQMMRLKSESPIPFSLKGLLPIPLVSESKKKHKVVKRTLAALGRIACLCRRYVFYCVFCDSAGWGWLGKGVRG